MVSINTSTSFLGTKKPEESGSDADISGLDNIFASMLNLIEEENKSINEHGESDYTGGMVGLLEKIKQEINSNYNPTTIGKSKENKSGALSTNVLQIYQTHKTLIDEAIEKANESTISFDMDRLVKPKLEQGNNLPVNPQKLETTTKFISGNKEEILVHNAIESSQDSLEEFSKLEMQKLRSSMRQDEMETRQLEIIDKKINSNSKFPQDVNNYQLSNLTKPVKQSVKEKELSFVDHKNVEIKSTPHTTDSPKVESLTTPPLHSNKLSSNGAYSNTQNLLSNQNADQTHLKLLEKNWGKDLAKIIEKAVVSGKEKININLYPQKLGKMQLTLSVVNNQTSIFISTENAAASLILTSSEERLAQMFESSGYKLSNFQANSEGKNKSNDNGSSTKHNKETKDGSLKTDLTIASKNENKISETVNGRKIINLIA